MPGPQPYRYRTFAVKPRAGNVRLLLGGIEYKGGTIHA